ncbi:MAG: 50S ribosomal protein L4 [Thermodesulfobacteriota bacterium]
MAVTEVKNIKGETVSKADLPDSIFDIEVKKSVLHEVVTMQLANRRTATASVRHRSDVQGSTVKLFRQKGTGRARRGDIRSPLLKGGGVTFGPNGRKYAYDVPKKIKKAALKMALASKKQENAITVVDSLNFDQIKTKPVSDMLKALGQNNVLFVTDGKNESLELSARNIPGVKVLRCEGLNVYDVLKYRHLVLQESALAVIEGRLS